MKEFRSFLNEDFAHPSSVSVKNTTLYISNCRHTIELWFPLPGGTKEEALKKIEILQKALDILKENINKIE